MFDQFLKPQGPFIDSSKLLVISEIITYHRVKEINSLEYMYCNVIVLQRLRPETKRSDFLALGR